MTSDNIRRKPNAINVFFSSEAIIAELLNFSVPPPITTSIQETTNGQNMETNTRAFKRNVFTDDAGKTTHSAPNHGLSTLVSSTPTAKTTRKLRLLRNLDWFFIYFFFVFKQTKTNYSVNGKQ